MSMRGIKVFSFLILFSSFFSLVFASCPATMVVDQQQLGSNFDNWINAYMWGTGSIARSQEIFNQYFIPSVTGEIPKIELYGRLGSTYNTNPALALSCFASGSSDAPLGTSAQERLAQQFYVNSSFSPYHWGSIRWKMLKASGLTVYSDIKVSIQADDGSGAPDGTDVVSALIEGSPSDGVWNYYPNNNTYMSFWMDIHNNPEVANLSDGHTYWVVWEVTNVTAPGVYWLRANLGTPCQGNASLHMAYYDGSWHGLANRQIEFEMNPTSVLTSSNNLCVSVYDGASFLKSTLIWFNSTSDGWSSTSPTTSWRDSDLCNTGHSADGPILTAGHTYTFSVKNPYYGDNFILSNYSADVVSNATFQYWGNPVPLVDPYGVSLKFKTYTCGASPSPTPSPTPGVYSVTSAEAVPNPVASAVPFLYKVYWTGGGPVYAVLCNTNSINASGMCSGTTISVSPGMTVYNPVTWSDLSPASYGSYTYYAFVCDAGLSCSAPVNNELTFIVSSGGGGLCNSGQRLGDCQLGDYCIYTGDCRVGLRCSESNKCEKMMTNVRNFGFQMFELNLSFLEIGLMVVLVVFVLLLLLGGRRD